MWMEPGSPLVHGGEPSARVPEKFAVLPTPVIYKAALDDLIQQPALAVKAKELSLDKAPETQRRIGEATDRAVGQALVRRIMPEMVTDKALEDRFNATIGGKPGPERCGSAPW
jgi:hypothetical protein